MSLAHSPSIVTNGLVLALDAANIKSYPGSGTVWNDLSGNGNHGTLVNTPIFESNAFTFNGTTQYVDLGDKFTYSKGSISFWTKLTASISIPYSGNVRPWGKNTDYEARWGGGTTNSGASIAFDLGASIGPPATLQSIQNSWSNAVWYNIVTTWDTAALTSKLYIQGSLDATGSCTAALASITGNFYVGRSVSAYYAGSISNFNIYDRELSVTEVKQNFNALKGRYGL